MTAGESAPRSAARAADDLLAAVAMRRIADAVLWLAGASYATGAVMSVDGGYTAR